MIPGLILVGTGLLAGIALVGASEEHGPRVDTEAERQAKAIEQAQAKFLPHASVLAENLSAKKGGGWLDWKSAAAHMPGLTEATALYFAMEDDETPLWVKGTMALALLYTVSPADFIPDEIPGLGQVDDLAVLYFTFRTVAPWVNPKHYEQAEDWLTSHGIEPKPFIDLGKILDIERRMAEYEEERGEPLPQLRGPDQ